MNGRSGFQWDNRSLLWATAIVAASSAFAWFVAGPQMAKARSLAGDVQTEQIALASRSHSLELIAKARKDAAALAARVADFEQRIPAEPKVGDFLEELARLAQKRDLQADTVQPGEPITTADVVALPIAIQVHGSFSGIHGLLKDIEHMSRLTRFEQLKATTDAEHAGLVTAELNLRIFYLPPDRQPKPQAGNDTTPHPPARAGSEARTG